MTAATRVEPLRRRHPVTVTGHLMLSYSRLEAVMLRWRTGIRTPLTEPLYFLHFLQSLQEISDFTKHNSYLMRNLVRRTGCALQKVL